MYRHNGYRSTKGFTIVELVIVIVVIAILTALIIVGYGAWRNNLSNSEVKNDLIAAGAALKNYKNFNNGYPATLPLGGTITGFTPSNDVDFVFVSTSTSDFCIEAVSAVNAGAYYYLRASEGDQPKRGNCALGEAYDPTLPSQIAMGATTYYTRSMTVDTATGDIYFSAGTNISKLTRSTGVISTIASGRQTDAMEFGGDGFLYIFSGAGSNVYIQKLNLSSGAISNVSATTVASGNGLYKSGNQLYVGSRNDIYALDITTGVLTSLFYDVSNMYSEGLVVVGSTLYFLRADTSIRSIPVTGSASATTVATIPVHAGRTSGNDLLYYNGSLYTYGSVPGSISIYAYKLSTSAWSIAVSNVQATGIYTCSSPGSLEIYNSRFLYVPANEPGSGLTCDDAATNSILHMTLIPAN